MNPLKFYSVQVHTYDGGETCVAGSDLQFQDALELAKNVRATRARNNATGATTVVHLNGYGRVWGIEDDGTVHVY